MTIAHSISKKHAINHSALSPNALKVLYRLTEEGFSAYLVGGCIRDLLLGDEPKDFDIATDAHPHEVRKIFRNCRLIGRRFRLAHVFFKDEIIEVATFRSSLQEEDSPDHLQSEQGMIIRDNVFGTIVEDAMRRDFSVNALYYNIKDDTLVDYTEGLQDLHSRILRIIGDPNTRFREDPVRILRAIRFMGKLNFTLEKHTEEAIIHHTTLLSNVSSSRLFDETLKLFHSGCATRTFELLRHYKLLEFLCPQAEALLSGQHPYHEKLVHIALDNTDQRIRNNQSVTPAFIFATLLWYPLQNLCNQYELSGMSHPIAFPLAGSEVLKTQRLNTNMPRFITNKIRDIWNLQYRLKRRSKENVSRLLSHPNFRAAYDFLVLRQEAGEDVGDLATWWTEYQAAGPEQKTTLLNNVRKKRRRK